ncbi:hypothetical protein RUM44_012630 [Polyplax serrata]|uniref:Odorant receptor n=1 Tax=Polyplax serrata TaxID=468196 RepID=A0ABR1BG21_POLSC
MKPKTDLWNFEYSANFNLLYYLGIWQIESGDAKKDYAHLIYRHVCFVALFTAIALQLIDFWMAIGDMDRMTYNLCTSTITTGSFFHFILQLIYSNELNELRRRLWLDFYMYDDEEDMAIKQQILKEMKFISRLFHLAAIFFYPVCMLQGYFSYLWGPREFPFPAFMPFHLESDSQYIGPFLVELIIGVIVLFGTIDSNLLVFGLSLQLVTLYKLLQKDLGKLNEVDYDEGNVKGEYKEINYVLRRIKTEQSIKELISRLTTLTGYVNTFRSCMTAPSVLPFICGFILMITNGVQVIQMSYAFNYRLIYEMVYLVLIFVDLFYFCYYITMLNSEILNVADAAYFSGWYKFDVKFQKYILLMMLQAQRAPRFSAGKLVSINLNTYLLLLKHTYSSLMLFRQLDTSQKAVQNAAMMS